METKTDPQVGETGHLPRIGEPAPPFEAESTFGTIRLEDFQGSWLIFQVILDDFKSGSKLLLLNMNPGQVHFCFQEQELKSLMP